jgi:hypothetical protein
MIYFKLSGAALLLMVVAGCATFRTPSWYGQHVLILNGQYKDEIGQLVEDCSGFEEYKVKLFKTNINTCIRIWNMRGLY